MEHYTVILIMFRTVLFAFINCLIISTPLLKERNRLRNEFIGRSKFIYR
jgi:hypothetical protein